MTDDRCPEDYVLSDDGYNRIASKCQLPAGHDGPHWAPITLIVSDDLPSL